MREAKQVIVWRKDLKVRLGKLVAQTSHASMKWIMDLAKKQESERLGAFGDNLAAPLIAESTKELNITYDIGSAIDQWCNGQFTKICVYVNSEAELLEIYEKSRAAGLITSIIIDSGKTEFHGIPTPTCVGIGPNFVDEINPVTGHLPLL